MVRMTSIRFNSWIQIHADNTATILTGGPWEGGQGSGTALLQIAGEELDMNMSQLKFVLRTRT